MKAIIIDNYDSFTYNLYHLIKELGVKVEVLRNDKFTLNELEMIKLCCPRGQAFLLMPDCYWKS